MILFCLFILLPIAEIYVIIQVGDAIGWAPTLLLLILDGFAGAALARSQGRVAWERFNLALDPGPRPGPGDLRRSDDRARRSLLLAPGFITDFVGFALLIPPTRACSGGRLTTGQAPGRLRLGNPRHATPIRRPASARL